MASAKDDKTAALTGRLCFVIGPIGKDGEEIRKHSDLLLHTVIRHVLQPEPFGYHVKRADEDSDPGMIGDRMITDILKAELVVADLTNLNANAFYELGIRHASRKPAIHIARANTILPFDNISQRTIFVDLTDWHSIEKARQALANMARFIEKSDFTVTNPITQAYASFKMRESDDPKEQLLAALREDFQRLEARIVGSAPPLAEHVAPPGEVAIGLAKLKAILRRARIRTIDELRSVAWANLDRSLFVGLTVFEEPEIFKVVLTSVNNQTFFIPLAK